MAGKVIDYYLVDGTLDGCIQLSSQSLQVASIKVPKSYLNQASKIDGLTEPGVYILMSEKTVYVGQTGQRANGKSFLQRWNEHIRNGKDWWEVALAFYSHSSDPFDSADLDWLESELMKRISNIGRYDLDNGNIPYQGKLSARKLSNLESSMETIELLLGIYSYNILKQKRNKKREKNTKIEEAVFQNEELIFYMMNDTAKMVIRGGKFVVLKDSSIYPASDKYPREKRIQKRYSENLSEGKTIIDIDFESPSIAAEFVSGKSKNGWLTWKSINGQILDDLLSRDTLSFKEN